LPGARTFVLEGAAVSVNKLCDSYEPGAAATGSHAEQPEARYCDHFVLLWQFGNLEFGNLRSCRRVPGARTFVLEGAAARQFAKPPQARCGAPRAAA